MAEMAVRSGIALPRLYYPPRALDQTMLLLLQALLREPVQLLKSLFVRLALQQLRHRQHWGCIVYWNVRWGVLDLKSGSLHLDREGGFRIF